MTNDLTEIGPELSFRRVIVQDFLPIEQRKHDLLHQILAVLQHALEDEQLHAAGFVLELDVAHERFVARRTRARQ